MLTSPIHLLFRREIIKSIKVLITIFLISIFLIIFFQTLNISNNFIKDIEKDRVLLNADLKKLHLSYEKHLKYIRSQIETKSLNRQNIYNYFNSDSALILDRSAINTVIVTDHNKNVIFSDLLDNNNGLESDQLKARQYLNKIALNPNQVVFGEIVTGILTNVPSIPIATGIRDKSNNYIGAIIFSVSLENLSKNLSLGSLKSIKVKNASINNSNIIETIKNNPFYYTIREILFGNSTIEIVSYNDLIKKYVIVEYDVSPYISEAVTHILIYGFIIMLVLSFIFIFYYYNILKPIRPTLQIIQNLSDANTSNKKISLFGSVVSSITKQSQLLQEKEYVYKEQLTQIISVICSIDSLTSYVKNKLEFLTEEIQDLSSAKELSNKHIKTKLRHIEQAVIDNENEVNSVLYSFNKIFKLLESQKKQEFKVIELLKQSNLDKDLLNDQVKTNNSEIVKLYDYSVFVYKSLFDTLIDEIIQFNSQSLSIKSVNVLDKKIEFIFKEIRDSKILSQHERLVLCKLWGIFNDILITLEYHKNEIKVICQFN